MVKSFPDKSGREGHRDVGQMSAGFPRHHKLNLQSRHCTAGVPGIFSEVLAMAPVSGVKTRPDEIRTAVRLLGFKITIYRHEHNRTRMNKVL